MRVNTGVEEQGFLWVQRIFFPNLLTLGGKIFLCCKQTYLLQFFCSCWQWCVRIICVDSSRL